MKNKKRDKILIYILFITLCISCIVSTILYADFYIFSESFSETRTMYYEDIDAVISTLKDLDNDKFFKYYKQFDNYILLGQYEEIKEEMIDYNTPPLLSVIIKKTYKISNRYGKIPLEFSVIDKKY